MCIFDSQNNQNGQHLITLLCLAIFTELPEELINRTNRKTFHLYHEVAKITSYPPIVYSKNNL